MTVGEVLGVGEGDGRDLDVLRGVADWVTHFEWEPEDSFGVGAAGIDEGEGEVGLAD